MNTLNVYRKWNIGGWVRTKLADVSPNVFPVVAPENTKGDIIVYRRSSYERDFSHMGYYLDSATIEVVVISDSYDRAAEIAVDTVRKYKERTGSRIKVIYNVFKDLDREIYEKLLGDGKGASAGDE